MTSPESVPDIRFVPDDQVWEVAQLTPYGDPISRVLDRVEYLRRPVPNVELARWVGMPTDATPAEVWRRVNGCRWIVRLDWAAQAQAWVWNSGPDCAAVHNRCPLDYPV